MSTISASTTTTTAYVVTADTTGALVLQTGASPTTAVTIDTSQNVGIGVAVPTAKLHITQTAASDALLVEDSANPDSSPFVIDAGGSVFAGYTSAESVSGFSGTHTPKLQVSAASGTTNGAGLFNYSSGATGAPQLSFAKSKSGVVGTRGVVSSGDTLGALSFNGDDGTNFINAATIVVAVDGTPGTSDMPGRLVFSTTADGASTPTERMRIDSAGDVGIGTTTPVTKLEIAGNNTSTWQVTASISTTTMTVTAVTSGTIAVGDLIYASTIAPYTRVTAFGTGTGGIGTYTVSVSQTVSSTSVLGTTNYGNTLIRITETDTTAQAGQPNGALQFYTSDASSPTAGVGAYVAALSESGTPDTALVFGTRDNAGGGIDANECMRITSTGGVSFGATGTAYGTSGQVLQSNGNAAPTWTTNISGNSANVTGTVAVANGGTGLTSIPHTVTVYTSGSGTYTTPANCKAIWVRCAGGGGGGASNGASGQNSGSGGGNTTFGTLTASGGAGAFYTATGGGASGGDINSSGGTTGVPGNTSPQVNQGYGGPGGSSVLGGGGSGGSNGGAAGSAPPAGYGGGGGGAGTNSTYIAMAGGAGGGYTEKLINSPSATYSYAVGAGGAGGTGGGTGGGVGGAGAAGVIIITEYYV